MGFTCDVAGSVLGEVRNLRLQFAAVPTLDELAGAAESLFTILLQARVDGCLGGSSVASRRAAVEDVVFSVGLLYALGAGERAWRPLTSSVQLQHGDQVVCVPPRGGASASRHQRRRVVPVAVTAGGEGDAAKDGGGCCCDGGPALMARLTAASFPADNSPVTVDALLVEEEEAEEEGGAEEYVRRLARLDIPPPERVVSWGRDSSAPFHTRVAERVQAAPPPSLHADTAPAAAASRRGVVDVTDRPLRSSVGGRAAEDVPSPMYLRPTYASTRRQCARLALWHRRRPSAEQAGSAREGREGGRQGAGDGGPQRATPSTLPHGDGAPLPPPLPAPALQPTTPQPAAEEEARGGGSAHRRQHRYAGRPSATPSPLPIPAAAQYSAAGGGGASGRRISDGSNARGHHRDPLSPSLSHCEPAAVVHIGFGERVRAVFAALPAEPDRPFLLLRDFFLFAKEHGQLSKAQQRRERGLLPPRGGDGCGTGANNQNGYGGGIDGSGFAFSTPPAPPSPFFTDRLRDAHGLSLEGVLRLADADDDGCVSYGEWVGFALENAAVAELFYLFLRHGGPITEEVGAAGAGSRAAASAKRVDAARTARPRGFALFSADGSSFSSSPFSASSARCGAGAGAGACGGCGACWEMRHLHPARWGMPRCDACELIAARLPPPLAPQPHRYNSLAAAPQQQTGAPLGLSPAQGGARMAPWGRSGPYPSAMPHDDFPRHVNLMTVRDALLS